MKLLNLKVSRYRCLREETMELGALNLFIGPNGSGKSTILDALRFLHEGVLERDFSKPVATRGGFLHLAWKGEEPRQIDLKATLEDAATRYEWSIRLTREGNGFKTRESVEEASPDCAARVVLEAENGTGWWQSEGRRVDLKQAPTACVLSAAAADVAFPARNLAEFVNSWAFFDPAPCFLREEWIGFSTDCFKLDSHGRNLAERLYYLKNFSPEVFRRVVSATQSVLGLPSEIDPQESEGRFYFLQTEPGLRERVHQVGVSSGTLRVLALMTALFGELSANLIGIEEPENHVHPTALASFAEYLLRARGRVQLLVTTHSPLLLDFLNEPEAVCIVRLDQQGTHVSRESNADAVREALEASGFGLGEFHETKGFGG